MFHTVSFYRKDYTMKKAEPTPAKLSRDKLAAEAITLNIAGLSTREIAKRLGTSPATISRILTGKTKLPEATVATYATISPSASTSKANTPPLHEGIGEVANGRRGSISPSASGSKANTPPLHEGIGEVANGRRGSFSPSASGSKIGGVPAGRGGFISTSDPQSIIDHAQSAVIDIIKRIQDVTYGEEDVAKLATAADKLTGVAERIANITRLANQQQAEQAEQSANSTFMRDFAARHKA